MQTKSSESVHVLMQVNRLEFIVIYTDVGCCCSLFDVVSSVVFSFCQQVSKQIVCFFFFFFFLPLSLYPPFSFFSLSLFPFFVDFPHNLFFFFFILFFFFYIYIFFFFFFFFFFLLSLSCFLCPLVLSVTVWLVKGYIKLKLIN